MLLPDKIYLVNPPKVGMDRERIMIMLLLARRKVRPGETSNPPNIRDKMNYRRKGLTNRLDRCPLEIHTQQRKGPLYSPHTTRRHYAQ